MKPLRGTGRCFADVQPCRNHAYPVASKRELAIFRTVISKLPFPTSLPDFMWLFPDDATCGAFLEKVVRWPYGFVC